MQSTESNGVGPPRRCRAVILHCKVNWAAKGYVLRRPKRSSPGKPFIDIFSMRLFSGVDLFDNLIDGVLRRPVVIICCQKQELLIVLKRQMRGLKTQGRVERSVIGECATSRSLPYA